VIEETMREGRGAEAIDRLRLDSKMLLRLRAAVAKRHVPYQSLINDLLANEMKKVG
jgi:predicted DNA binding CopG/RHH family protein